MQTDEQHCNHSTERSRLNSFNFSSQRISDDARRRDSAQRSSIMSSGVFHSLPALSSVEYGGAKRRRSSRAPLSANPAHTVLPALHASTNEGYVPARFRKHPRDPPDPSTVTIPRGLKPKEVPKPLRAMERWGKAPVKPRTTQAGEDLYTRWVIAYTYGTADSGEYSFYKFGDDAGNKEEEDRSNDILLSIETKSMTNSSNLQIEQGAKTVPENMEKSNRSFLEAWMDPAGYFVTSYPSDDADRRGPRRNNEMIVESERNAKKGRGQSSPFLSVSSSELSNDYTVKLPTPPVTLEEAKNCQRLDRVWTPSPPLYDLRRVESAVEELCLMPVRANDDNTPSAAIAPTKGKDKTMGGDRSGVLTQTPQQSLLESMQILSPGLKSDPFSENDLAPDLDVSDNNSRHVRPVSPQRETVDVTSRSCGCFPLSGDEPRHEMENESVENDEHNARPMKNLATRDVQLQPMKHAVRESSSLSKSSGLLQRDAAGCTLESLPNRFSRNGRSAATIGSQRVLTLLMVVNPTTHPKVTSDGTQVTLSSRASPTGGTRTVTVDEAVTVKDGDERLQSSLLHEVAEEVGEGYGAALLLSVAAGCGGVGCTAVENTLRLALASMRKRQSREQSEHARGSNVSDGINFFFKMEVSIALVHKGKYIKDLIKNPVEGLGLLVPASPIANPLLGSWCDNTSFQSVQSESQIQSLLQPVQMWLLKSPEEAEKMEEVICIFVVLRQVDNRAKPEDRCSLMLSSLLIYVSRAQNGAVGILRNRGGATILQRTLLRRVGGGCFTVVATCVRDGAERAVRYASCCSDACTITNNGLISGDAVLYMDMLREATAREKAEAAANPGDDIEQQHTQQRLDLQNDFLRGIAGLLSDPGGHEIPFYVDHIASLEEVARVAARTERVKKCPATTNTNIDEINIPNLPEALEMFGDCQVHTVAIYSTTEACGYERIGGTDTSLMRLADGATFYADELRPRQALLTLQAFQISKHTSALCTLFASGHNAALVSFDGRSSNVFSSPAWCVLAEAINRALNCSGGKRSKVCMAVSLVRGSGETLDLMDPDATMVPLQVSSSPLFGTAVYTSKLHPVTSQNTLRDVLHTLASKAASMWTSDAFLHVLLVNLLRNDDDVFVSSFKFSVFGSHATMCEHVLANGEGTSKSDSSTRVHPNVLRLHYGFLSGAAASVFLASLNTEKDADTAMKIIQKDLPRLSKAAPRSGSVKEFIHRTRSCLEKYRAKVPSATPAERAYLACLELRITEMLEDNATLLVPNSDAFPKAYLMEQVAMVRQPTPTPTRAETSEEERGQEMTRVPPATATTRPEYHDGDILEDMSLREDSRGKGMRFPGHGSTANKNTAADDLSETALSCTVTSSHPQWVLGLELSGLATTAVQAFGEELEWTPTKERFNTDGIIFYNSARYNMKYLFTEHCEAMKRLLDDACEARSCAILGLVDSGGSSSNLHVRTQPLWRSFTGLVLNSAFQHDAEDADAATVWKNGSELHIRMCAVQDRTLLYDFLLDGDDEEAEAVVLPRKVALAANPLFGPVVRNTTVMRATNIKECQCIFRIGLNALNNLACEYPSGTILIASAVLKNVTHDDILFSSISAFGVRIGKDLRALRDILAMDPQGGAPPSLYQYALHGPCHLLCLTTLDSAVKEHCVEALRLSQGIRYGVTPPVPTGSLHKCLQEQQDLLSSNGTNEQARANTEHVVRQLLKMINDPFSPIVIFPFDDGGASPLMSPQSSNDNDRGTQGGLNGFPASSTDSSQTGNASCRVTTVVTVAVRGEPSIVDARVATNTVRLSQASYTFSEVVLRANSSSVLRPGLISSIVRRVQQGRNTALVVADGVGSNTGVTLLSKLVSTFISNADDNENGVNTSIFMSVSAVRFADAGAADATTMVTDLFNEEMHFYPLKVAHSPFFGPCIDGARFSSLNRVGDVYLTFKDAQKVCAYLKATLVVVIVLKQLIRATNGSVQDVLMSSLFSVINSTETSNGAYACSIFDSMLDQREAMLAAPSPNYPLATAWRRCLLAQAFGGNSFTYGVVGLTANAEEAEAECMLQFGARLMQVSCQAPARSSAVEFLQQATRKLQEASSGSTHDAPSLVLGVPWDWQLIKDEAEEMLRSPEMCQPRAFLCD